MNEPAQTKEEALRSAAEGLKACTGAVEVTVTETMRMPDGTLKTISRVTA